MRCWGLQAKAHPVPAQREGRGSSKKAAVAAGPPPPRTCTSPAFHSRWLRSTKIDARCASVALPPSPAPLNRRRSSRDFQWESLPTPCPCSRAISWGTTRGCSSIADTRESWLLGAAAAAPAAAPPPSPSPSPSLAGSLSGPLVEAPARAASRRKRASARE